MRKFLLSAFALSSLFSTAFAQINTETFESNPSFISVAGGGLGFTVTNTGGNFINGSTGSGARPASTPYASNGSNAYQMNNNSGHISTDNISTVGASFIAVQFRLMAVSLNTTNGMEDDDFVRVSISPDGGTTWYNTLEVTGATTGQSWWGYSATGIAQANYDGNNTPTVVRASVSGNNSAGPSTVIVRGLPTGISNLRVRITMDCSNNNERWVIDDVQIIRTSGGPLPVNFANVQARAEGVNTTISWSNLTESDVDYYAVERSSDGRTFEVIGKLQPRANNYSKQDYSFVDASPLASGFYRVKAVEFNATTKTSIVLRVSSQNRGRKGGFHVYPNPVQGGILSLQASDAEGGTYNIQLFNSNGQRVYSKVVQLQGGVISQSLELPSHVKPGMYLLKIQGATTQTTSTVIVQ